MSQEVTPRLYHQVVVNISDAETLVVVQAGPSCLKAADEIKCEFLNDHQWVILHQIEITLQKMAWWQRILEGDTYPTGSLVVSAIFSIRM